MHEVEKPPTYHRSGMRGYRGGILFVSYGRVLPGVPFATTELNHPTVVDSDGSMTVIVDGESRRALILNAEGKLTGTVDCSSLDSPMEAINDVCVSDGVVYIAGVTYKPDSDVIDRECVATYDSDGSMRAIIFELSDMEVIAPAIKSLSDTPGGVTIAYEKTKVVYSGDKASKGSGLPTEKVDVVSGTALMFANENEKRRISSVDTSNLMFYDIAFSGGNRNRYAAITVSGGIQDSETNRKPKFYDGHVFISVDLDDSGDALYVCDDVTGALCIINSGSDEVLPLVAGTGFDSVHVNGDSLSFSDSKAGVVKLCDLSGAVRLELDVVEQSASYSIRMLLVWASGLYLVVLAVVLAVRELRRRIREGDTKGIAPMFMAVAVVAAIAVAIANLSYASYHSSLEQRAGIINACADYLSLSCEDIGKSMEQGIDRSAFRRSEEGLSQAYGTMYEAAWRPLMLVNSMASRGTGLYCALYAKDEHGVSISPEATRVM